VHPAAAGWPVGGNGPGGGGACVQEHRFIRVCEEGGGGVNRHHMSVLKTKAVFGLADGYACRAQATGGQERSCMDVLSGFVLLQRAAEQRESAARQCGYQERINSQNTQTHSSADTRTWFKRTNTRTSDPIALPGCKHCVNTHLLCACLAESLHPTGDGGCPRCPCRCRLCLPRAIRCPQNDIHPCVPVIAALHRPLSPPPQ
jgi:hypothetical protein